MKTTMKRILVAFLLLGLTGVVHAASPPDQINFQGVLRDDNNDPLDGDFDMQFRFFDMAAGGTETMLDQHLLAGTGQVTVSAGLLSVALGRVLFFRRRGWLGSRRSRSKDRSRGGSPQ